LLATAANLDTSSFTQTLEECVSRSTTQWPLDSIQHKERLATVIDLFINTGDPVTRVDRPSFRAMWKKADPKFRLPGNYNCIHISILLEM